MSFNMN